jgi:peptidyl-Asp metalloendopeptidase
MNARPLRPSSLFLAFAFVLTGLAAAGCDSHAPPASDETQITLLVAYTAGARAAVPDITARILQTIEETNAVYRNGRIAIRLVPVHLAEVAYEPEERLLDLERLLDAFDGYLDEVHVWRDLYEADVVALVTEMEWSTINASIMAVPATAFVIVHHERMGAPGYALLHEIGHLQGARHSPDADPALEPFSYGHGFRNDSLRTIMATSRRIGVPHFSGPDQVYQGLVLGDAGLHDNARVLRQTAVYISNFRGATTPTDFVPPGHWPVFPVAPGAASPAHACERDDS